MKLIDYVFGVGMLSCLQYTYIQWILIFMLYNFEICTLPYKDTNTSWVSNKNLLTHITALKKDLIQGHHRSLSLSFDYFRFAESFFFFFLPRNLSLSVRQINMTCVRNRSIRV